MSEPQTPLTDLVSSAGGRDDEPSITEVHGTIARFEMAYSPPADERTVFGPPAMQRWPSLIWFTFTAAVLISVVLAYTGSSNSRLYVWVVEGDRGRPLPAWLLSLFIFASGVATVARARMRGVVVTGDGLEARYLMALGVPRVQKWTWAQMDRFVIDKKRIMVELWNGTHEVLPPVAETARLGDLLERIAIGRKKEVTRLRD